MAYAAVISLKNTIHRLQNSSRISFVFPSKDILEFLHKGAKYLQAVLEQGQDDEGRVNSDQSERAQALEVEMREAASELQDKLESRVSTQILSQSETDPMLFSINLLDLKEAVDCFFETAMKVADEYTKELQDNTSLPDDDHQAVVSSATSFGGNVTEMVGLNDKFAELRGSLLENSDLSFLGICGMAGIGKTTLAKKILEDPLIKEHFPCRIFFPVGQKIQLKKTVQDIVTQVYANVDETFKERYNGSWERFHRRRCLIVLDDVWDVDLLYNLEGRFSDVNTIILVTTRLLVVAVSLDGQQTLEMRFMNNLESWNLLRGKVFGEEECPPQLEKAGKKIAENCEGLPLLIVTIAGLLSKDEKTQEHWNMVAKDKRNPVFQEAYDLLLEVLYPSYNYLPLHLKPYFLFTAVFPPNSEFCRSRLINLLIAEEFLRIDLNLHPYEYLKQCFWHLCLNSVVVAHPSMLEAKTFSLHSVFWHLCKKEAGKNKFLHILDSYADGLDKSIEGHRRLSIYKNILFAIKDVYNSMASVSNARSLLCTGAYHPYQVPMCFGLRLLRVFDALTVRFYEFPAEVLKQILLRYLALTYNGNLHPSIYKLWKLQYLIIHQHLSINSSVAPSYMPVEIWYLQELKYLRIIGRNLPDPPRGAVLPDLLTLLDVGPQSCTRSVLMGIPNLEKLRVRVEMFVPDAAHPMKYNLDHISLLCKLKSLQCIIVNPEIVVPAPPLPVFGSSVEKLTLSGFGYPWKDIDKIAVLPNLRVLKLQCYAFQGEKWEAKKKGFLKLEKLYIEDTNLVEWSMEGELERLDLLALKNCYKLKEIPRLRYYSTVQMVDCNPSVHMAVTDCPLSYVKSSWDES